MSKRLTFAIALVAIAMLAVACGGGGAKQNDSSSSSAATATSGQNVEVALSDFKFTPSNLTVKQGDTVTVTLKNDGAVAHDFKIEAFGVESELVRPGQSATLTFTADKTGQFEIICTEPGHAASGMKGTLVVQ